jgi:hypothetical protein
MRRKVRGKAASRSRRQVRDTSQVKSSCPSPASHPLHLYLILQTPTIRFKGPCNSHLHDSILAFLSLLFSTSPFTSLSSSPSAAIKPHAILSAATLIKGCTPTTTPPSSIPPQRTMATQPTATDGFAPILKALATMQSNVAGKEKAEAHTFLEKFQKSVCRIPSHSKSPYQTLTSPSPKHGMPLTPYCKMPKPRLKQGFSLLPLSREK